MSISKLLFNFESEIQYCQQCTYSKTSFYFFMHMLSYKPILRAYFDFSCEAFEVSFYYFYFFLHTAVALYTIFENYWYRRPCSGTVHLQSNRNVGICFTDIVTNSFCCKVLNVTVFLTAALNCYQNTTKYKNFFRHLTIGKTYKFKK